MSSARRELISWTRTGWTVVVIHAALFAAGSLYGGWKASFVPLFLLVIAVSGLMMRWGPAVFLPVAGFFFGLFWAPSPYGAYAHNAHEAMMEDIGIPVICAAVGAAVGIFAEIVSRFPTDAPEGCRQHRPLRRRGSPVP